MDFIECLGNEPSEDLGILGLGDESLWRYSRVSVQPDTTAIVEMVWAEGPDHFFVRCQEDMDEDDHLRHVLDLIYNDSLNPKKAVTGVSVGSPCVAKYHQDSRWYRAVVVDKFWRPRQSWSSWASLLDDPIEDLDCEVHFVDYGDSDRVPIVSHVQALHPAAISYPISAVKCKLLRIDEDMLEAVGSSRERAKKLFTQICQQASMLTCCFLFEDFDYFVVDLLADGVSVDSQLRDALLPQQQPIA